MISIFKHLQRQDGVVCAREYNEIVYRLETVLYFRITNTFFSTTLGTNKHAVNRFLCPFCAYLAKGSFFLSAGGNALPYMQIADARPIPFRP